MTPEEKARYLIEEFRADAKTYRFPKRQADPDFFAKECAIICVDEILEVCESYDNYNATDFSQVKYWKEVKEHLTKL